MLKHTGRFAVGQKIRGYSFVGRKDSYLEGVVNDANHTREYDGVLCYQIDITCEMFGGKDVTQPNDTGWIPHGTLFEYDDRIEEVK